MPAIGPRSKGCGSRVVFPTADEAVSAATCAQIIFRDFGPERRRAVIVSMRYAKLGRIVVYEIGDLDAWETARKRTSTLEILVGNLHS